MECFMNQSYRLVWSAVRGAWAVVSELAKSHAKSGAAMVVAAATTAMPAQAVVIDSSQDLNSTGAAGSVQASSSVGFEPLVEFATGQTFTFSSERSLLNSNGSTAKITEQGAGGGTYNLTKTDSAQTEFAGIQVNNGGLIDLSNAKKSLIPQRSEIRGMLLKQLFWQPITQALNFQT